MELLNELISLIGNPLGAALLIGGIGIALIAKPSRPRLRWFLLAAFGFAASLSKHQSQWVEEPPALAFPLDELRAMGRPISLVLLGILLLNILVTQQPNWRRQLLPTPIVFLAMVQGVIVLKILVYGSLSFAVLTVFIYVAMVVLITFGPSKWLQCERDFIWAMVSIAMVGIFFAIANLYQAAIDIYPITFLHGWFLGTTGNPHHAAVLIVAVLPCLLFFCHHTDQHLWQKWFWRGCLGLAIAGLAATASRTGLAMGVAATSVFYWRQGNRLIQLGFIVALVALTGLTITDLIGLDINLSQVFDGAVIKVERGQDTRSHIFLYFWNNFLDYPLFGRPLVGERLRFGESSWLGVAGSLGLAGLIPMVLFGYTTCRMIFRLNNATYCYPSSILLVNTVTSGLVALLLGGMTEAYLLGNLSFAVLSLFLYLSMGNFLLEVMPNNFAAQPVRNYEELNPSLTNIR